MRSITLPNVGGSKLGTGEKRTDQAYARNENQKMPTENREAITTTAMTTIKIYLNGHITTATTTITTGTIVGIDRWSKKSAEGIVKNTIQGVFHAHAHAHEIPKGNIIIITTGHVEGARLRLRQSTTATSLAVPRPDQVKPQ